MAGPTPRAAGKSVDPRLLVVIVVGLVVRPKQARKFIVAPVTVQACDALLRVHALQARHVVLLQTLKALVLFRLMLLEAALSQRKQFEELLERCGRANLLRRP